MYKREIRNKSEIMNSKSESNSKAQIRKMSRDLVSFFFIVLLVCFGFRVSSFGFYRSLLGELDVFLFRLDLQYTADRFIEGPFSAALLCFQLLGDVLLALLVQHIDFFLQR